MYKDRKGWSCKMGIKDNFTQAVKELLERDNLVGKKDQSDQNDTSELSRYLRNDDDEKEDIRPGTLQTPPPSISTPPPRVETPFYTNTKQSAEVKAQADREADLRRFEAKETITETPVREVKPASYKLEDDEKETESSVPYQAAPSYTKEPGYIDDSEETTIISRNTVIDGNIRSFANMNIDGNVKGNVETTKNVEMSGKIVGDVICNNMGMHASAMQGSVRLKGRIKVDRDTLLIGDLYTQYADINGKVKGNIEVSGKAEFKRDSVIFGDISASTIAVIDGAIIQGYVNTTFLNKDDSKNLFPDSITVGE